MRSAEAAGPGIRRYRATVRTRLALTYSALLTGAGIVMLTVVYLVMRFLPSYELVAAPTVPAQSLVPTDSTSAVIPDPGMVGEPAAAVTPSSALVITSTDQMFNLLLVISVVVLVVLAIVGIAVGWAVAGRVLAPLQYINSAASRAAHGDLSQRIGLTGPRDEISELAANFDDMLAQLERSFAASRRFALNASHELLTPLATTRAMLDVAIAQRKRPEDQQVFDRLRVMNERSIETVEALLDLAQIQSSTASPEPVDLAQAAAAVVESAAEEATERGVRVELELEPAAIEAEPVLVRQLLTNLVHNAIRHNLAEGGFLRVATGADAEGATIELSNSGAVLSPADVAALTEQFTRVAGRTTSSSAVGHGLGLSIVAAIVDRFEGTLQLTPRPGGGLLVRVTVPAAA
ncbi:sensor histidine kinase [Microterricola viridarii]|uniref:histidine kinase n=1 Tax=Microterricola viridarii TaxID=412690 RepID=A0A1H1WE34_9MICO|nr:HAMP domain-containing sensor histidine kinase [Microterricola viridarii]SDS95282.1 two-component system, OmpR family, sensor histidine kinase VanS [Microterricola viridarii]